MLILCLLGAAPLGACDSLDIPRGPDLSEVAEVYDSPDGALSEEELHEVMLAADQALLTLEQLGNLEFLVTSLERVGEVIRDAAQRDSNSIVGITGVTEVHSICPGLEATPTREKENGYLDFTVTFDKSYIDEVVWGDFSNCKTYQYGEGVTFDGSMDIYLGQQVYLGDLQFDSLLYRLAGSYTHKGITHDLDFDFRRIDGGVETRLRAKGGDVILKVGSDRGKLAVRTSDGSFCCSFLDQVCYLLDGDDCDSGQAGKKITW